MLPDGDPFKTILVEWRTDSSRIESTANLEVRLDRLCDLLPTRT